jgi:hypothetical protein
MQDAIQAKLLRVIREALQPNRNINQTMQNPSRQQYVIEAMKQDWP